MNFVACVTSLAALALPALAQSPAAEPVPLLHLSTSFDLVVHAPYAVTAPLFGPRENAHGPASIGIRNLSIPNPRQT